MTGNRPDQQVATTATVGNSPAVSQPSTPMTPPAAVETSADRGIAPAAPQQLLVFPRPGQTVAAEDLTFHWNGGAKAHFYELQLLSDDGDVIWETQTKSSSAKLPASVHLSKGRTYYLRLRIHGDHASTEESKTVPFVAG
jgi:hypothetical protein